MRLVTFTPRAHGPQHLGLVRNGTEIIDLKNAGSEPPFDAADMISLIVAGDGALTWLRDVASKSMNSVPLDQVLLLAPIPRPRKNVFCVGWNYLDHFAEGGAMLKDNRELPQYPVFFTKTPTTVNGPFDVIPTDDKVSTQLDWEVELGVIIGTTAKNIAEADAMKHIFGYTVINDVSWRDIQRRHGGQWHKGKSLDGTCPMGPCIVTADSLDPTSLDVECRVNGVVKQKSNTKHLYFKIPRLIHDLSEGMTLEAGDIISTGTPEGVGYARTPAEFMKDGDLMETEIQGIGVMRNPIGSY